MNKIHRLVVNCATGACQAVSEVAKGSHAATATPEGRPGGLPARTRLATACLLALGALASPGLWAQQDVYFGTDTTGAAGIDGAAGSAALQAVDRGYYEALLTGGAGGTGIAPGGRGGDGGAGLASSASNVGQLLNAGTLAGGQGGAGGGDGGSGGAGLASTTRNVVLLNTGAITGGQGGAASGMPLGTGGEGGVGVALGAPATLLNLEGGTITGGRGGSPASTAGGVGVTAAGGNTAIENAGTLRGGLSADGLSRADAIRFTGDNNWLGLLSTSVIEGNVVASPSGGDTLALTGSTDGSFDAALVGPAAQYRNFAALQKLGTGTWTLTGSTAALTPWYVNEGTLAIASDASLGDAAGALTLDGGTLRTTADIASGRAIVLGAGSGTLESAAGTTHTVGGAVSGAGALTKAGSGTLVLTADNTHSGGTTVAAGTLQLGDGGTSGAIAGDVANQGTLAFNRSDATTFAGAISGLGNVEQRGTGTTTLTGTNTYSGGTTIAAGTLAASAASLGSGAIANNGALRIDQAQDAVLRNALSGSGTFTKAGAGTLALRGDSAAFAGSTQAAAGTLAVDGALGGTLTVASGARLAGTGTVGTTTVQSGATLAPGNGDGLGRLSVAGNLTLAPGSTYQVSVRPDGQGSALAASGAAALQGGAVSVLASGNWSASTSYTILNAAGGVSGRFGAVGTNMAFLEPSLAYGPQSVSLRLQRNDVTFQSVAQTPNQLAAAGGVAGLRTGPLYSAVVQLNATDARAAFDALSGEVHASLKSATIEDSRFVRSASLERARRAAEPSSTVPAAEAASDGQNPQGGAWAQAFDSWGDDDGNANASLTSRSARGLFLGADTRVAGDWRLGVLGGYSRSRLTLDNRASGASSDTYHLGVYGGKQWGALGLRLGASHSAGKADTSRSIAFTGVSTQASGRYDVDTTQLFGELGWRVPTAHGAVEPFASLARVRVRTDAFTESGGPAALSAGKASSGTTYGTLGVRASRSLDLAGVSGSLRGSVGWRHAAGDTAPSAALALAGQNGFATAGTAVAKNALVLEGGLDFALQRNLTLGVSYVGQLASRMSDHGVKASLLWKF